MPHHQYNRLRSKLSPFIKFALVVACLGMLASCGGGSGSTATMPTAQAPETINGIAVPPEPNPTVNNATLAGVDSNNNGVRDDVERKIAEKLGASPINYEAAIKIAKTEQTAVLNPTQENIQMHLNSVTCSKADKPARKVISTITKESLNTKQRATTYAKVFAGVALEDCPQ